MMYVMNYSSDKKQKESEWCHEVIECQQQTAPYVSLGCVLKQKTTHCLAYFHVLLT